MAGPNRRLMHGLPEQIAADLRQYQDLGVQNFILGFRGDSVEGQREAMEQFSREVMPLIPQE
jgi:alkanesulfonate monooxygenase SsuD/methylene tetrahydromethanopterin reductase-like flavin-dependent oxidoreductase (luciferase family)